MYKAFEQRILDGTLEYYSKVSETAMQKFYIDEKSFVAYLKHVQSSLLDEMKRATLLHSTTETALMRVCYDSLISKHEDVFCAEFQVRLWKRMIKHYSQISLNLLFISDFFNCR